MYIPSKDRAVETIERDSKDSQLSGLGQEKLAAWVQGTVARALSIAVAELESEVSQPGDGAWGSTLPELPSLDDPTLTYLDPSIMDSFTALAKERSFLHVVGREFSHLTQKYHFLA